MYRRVEYEPWHAIWPVLAFIITVAVFIFAVWWVIRLPKEKVRHQAHLPLVPDPAELTTEAQSRREQS